MFQQHPIPICVGSTTRILGQIHCTGNIQSTKMTNDAHILRSSFGHCLVKGSYSNVQNSKPAFFILRLRTVFFIIESQEWTDNNFCLIFRKLLFAPVIITELILPVPSTYELYHKHLAIY